ncbi:hypothetical protein D3C76_989940 [compost metagenome]
MAAYNQDLKDLDARATVSRKEYDYQINARALNLKVLAMALHCVEANHEHHTTYSEDPDEGYQGSALEQDNLLAIKILKQAIGL